MIIYTSNPTYMRTWQSNRSPHWKRHGHDVSILASPVLRALDGSFIVLFFTWSSLYIIEPYITSITWLIVRRLWFKSHRHFHCHMEGTCLQEWCGDHYYRLDSRSDPLAAAALAHAFQPSKFSYCGQTRAPIIKTKASARNLILQL